MFSSELASSTRLRLVSSLATHNLAVMIYSDKTLPPTNTLKKIFEVDKVLSLRLMTQQTLN